MEQKHSHMMIKGQCEHCGFAYTGACPTVDGVFVSLACPSCGKETENFDEADAVNALNKESGDAPAYVKSTLRAVSDTVSSEQAILTGYLHDLYALFMKRMATFIVEDAFKAEDSVKLQAMISEIIKVKKLIGNK